MRGKIIVILVSILLGLAIGAFAYGANEMADNQRELQAALQIRDLKSLLMISLIDAEAGQRGFLIIPRSDYLEPYTKAVTEVPRLIKAIEAMGTTQHQRDFLRNVEPVIQRKLDEMGETIVLRATASLDKAVVVVATDEGKHIMDEIRRRFTAERTYEVNRRDGYLSKIETLTALLLYDVLAMLGLLITITVMLRGTREVVRYVEKESPRYHDDLEPNAKLDAIIQRFREMSGEL